MTQEQMVDELGSNPRFDLLLIFRQNPEGFKEHVKNLFAQAAGAMEEGPIQEVINEDGPVAKAVDGVVDLHSFLNEDIAVLDRNCLDIIKVMDKEAQKVFLGRYIIALARSTYRFTDAGQDYLQRAWDLLWEDSIIDEEITQRCRLEIALAYAALGNRESVAALVLGVEASPANEAILEEITDTLESHSGGVLAPNWP